MSLDTIKKVNSDHNIVAEELNEIMEGTGNPSKFNALWSAVIYLLGHED